MDFGFSEEQDLLRAEVRKFLDARCPLERVRKLSETGPGYDAELWRELAELGWLGLTIPEAYGGAGLGWVDLVVLLQETGRSLFPSPLVSTTLAAAAVLENGSEEQRQRWLPSLADGTRIGTLAFLETSDSLAPGGIALLGKPDGDAFALTGEKKFVADAGSANLFVVAFRTGAGAGDLALAVLDAGSPGVSAAGHPTIDATKRLGTLKLENARVPRSALLGAASQARPAIERLYDLGAVAVTAELTGAAEQAHALTTQYAKDRIQFGAPIGKYQGVKHPLAEMYVELESTKSLLYYAAWAVAESPGELPRAASLAKAFGTDAFTRIGIDGVQLHGAVGYTAEYEIQLYLKRAKWARPVFGDSDFHYERVARLGGL
ncbi:MAG TPA: acyl-CoA dehydrogenase family protein [Myxococcota bacterium]|nr:acyl-CoA dehydrogenase family protein [Myxococcota bacterium]